MEFAQLGMEAFVLRLLPVVARPIAKERPAAERPDRVSRTETVDLIRAARAVKIRPRRDRRLERGQFDGGDEQPVPKGLESATGARPVTTRLAKGSLGLEAVVNAPQARPGVIRHGREGCRKGGFLFVGQL